MTTYESLIVKADQLLKLCSELDVRICTAESCTGGLISACITEVPGSSTRFDRGFVTYSNNSKQELLGVEEENIQSHGAVSKSVAVAMAKGALDATKDVNMSIAVTGIAGPDGGTEEKPVGLVHFAFARDDGNVIHKSKTFGDIGRSKVRLKTVGYALDSAKDILNETN